ncbi:Transketolase, thiamine diphosphate binding domain-containing protein [Hygrophoropsis aurantiaca]|uniref:Transketolase, thiamine diphosphate binding domain-containing protein n=1 Tax=Hygrophoropsis aurantiaca TaxID=72124 RepID=A0ACB8ARY8_9AGAM|nr:Transketolase, thiamine diphosphate binding domain-containing protein [Hygrophoropsis aurantiaca]
MSTFTPEPTDDVSIATIRTLAADVVGKANSGHPGAPMGMAPAAHVLFTRFFNANPKSSKWFNRDRFVLSNGCALQYILLHLHGYKLSMDDLKAFRQLDSLTPGHPEAHHTDGIEVTTGPLGQGFANGVGLAMAQEHLGAVYNRDNFELVNNYTYVFTGDGCLMEGVASEAASLAGHLQLGNLIVVYDDNHISIDGDTAVAFTENVEQRFLSYGWQVLHVDNGDSDLAAIHDAIVAARAEKNKPTIIRLRTTIGFGSKQQGTHGVHGSPLKADDIQSLKTMFGFPPDQTFHVPKETYDTYRAAALRGARLESEWASLLSAYGKQYPNEHAELTRRISGKLPEGWEKTLPVYKPSDPAQASRKLSEIVLTAITPAIPDLIGGSADLTGSNLTKVKGTVDFQPPSTKLGTYAGTYIRYGVREHGMGAIANGLSAYGGIVPFVATFLNFVSYAAGAVRLSALSKHQVIWVATHDSIGLGEDGPTHQPVETAVHLRAIPNLDFWRPADGNETSAAYLVALQSTETPSVLSLSRQNLPNLEGSTIERASRGGYVVHEVEGEDLTIVSSGSEVSIALEAASKLVAEGLKVRIVSLPCWSVFDKQDAQYRLSVLRSGAPILSLEALSTTGWQKYSHEQFGLPAWGASGPYQKVYEKFGITGTNIASVSKKVISFYKQKGGEVVSPLVKAL